jgi:hypothetical protein
LFFLIFFFGVFAVFAVPVFFFPYFFSVFSTRCRGKIMGNGNVLRVVGRDARGRESNGLARAARFVREHATELGVGAALLGGAILAGTFHHKRAVPTEPVNEFVLHMPRPGPAPVARLPVPPPNSDEHSRSPASGYKPHSPRSETDAGAPEGDILTVEASEAGQSKLDGLQAKPEAPLASASSDLDEAADVGFDKSLRDMVEAINAANEKKRQHYAAEVIADAERARKVEAERLKRKAPSATPRAIKPKTPKQDEPTEWKRKKEKAEVDAYDYFGVERREDKYPSTEEIEEVQTAIKNKLKETHPDRAKDEGEALNQTLDHYNVLRKGRMEFAGLEIAKRKADERAEYLERQKRNEERQSFGRSRLYV